MSYKDFSDYVARLGDYRDRLALSCRPFVKNERLSYKDLQQKVYQVAHYLRDTHLKPGDRIIIAANNSPEWVVLYLGSQISGIDVVTVDATSSYEVLMRFKKQTRARHIFYSSYLYPELANDNDATIIDDLFRRTGNYPALPLEKGTNQASTIVFTSGTTAVPKGVVLTAENILSNLSGIQERIEVDPSWRLLSVLPLSHMYELTGTLAVLSKGASIFYMTRVTPSAIATALVDYQITTILAIPQLLGLLLDKIKQTASEEDKAGLFNGALNLARFLPFRFRRLLFSSVHKRLGGKLGIVVTGGAPIPIEVAKTWELMGVKAVQGYGLTETSPILTVNGLNERRLDSPGQPLSNLKLRISKDGEIQAKGPSVFSGYLNNPEATKEAFTSDGWFRTGDIGELKNNWLFIKGRLKFAIVLSSGLKVFPEDIETIAAKHGYFIDGLCIVGVKSSQGESVAAVVISDKSDEEINRTISDLNNELEPFQSITSFKRWPQTDFPRTRLLKVDRRKVWDWANNQANVPKAPETGDGDKLLEILRLSLNEQSRVINDTNQLGSIGLDSLKRLVVVALIEERLGISVSEDKVTNTTTVETLRELVRNGNKSVAQEKTPKWPFNRFVRLFGGVTRDTIIKAIVGFWVKVRVEGVENLENLKTPVIFIFNHVDNFDGPVMYRALPRKIRNKTAVAQAADVMKDHKVIAFISRFCFAGFPFSRTEPYLPSLISVGNLTDKGWNILFSPEGSILEGSKTQPFKSGIGLLAVELGLPVIVLKSYGLAGTVPLHAQWPKKHSQVVVRFSEPVTFDEGSDYEEVAVKLENIMHDL